MAINRDKIQKACEDMRRVFDELELTPEERGIVCSSGYKAAKIKQMDEEIQNDIIETLQKPTLEENMMKVLPAITASAAIIISLIALAIKII